MSLPEVWTIYLLKVWESLKSDSVILLSTPSKKYQIISEYKQFSWENQQEGVLSPDVVECPRPAPLDSQAFYCPTKCKLWGKAGALHPDFIFSTQCNAMQYNAIQCNAMQRNANENAVRFNAMQCNAMWCDAMQLDAMLCAVAEVVQRGPKRPVRGWPELYGRRGWHASFAPFTSPTPKIIVALGSILSPSRGAYERPKGGNSTAVSDCLFNGT